MAHKVKEDQYLKIFLELPSDSEASFCSSNDIDDLEAEENVLKKYVGEDILADSDEESPASEEAYVSCSAATDICSQPGPSHHATTDLPGNQKTSGLNSGGFTQNNIVNQFSSQPRSLLWYAGKDNYYANNIPSFLGKYSINIDGEEPYDFFMHIFTEQMCQLILEESNRYAFQKGKTSFKLTMNELKAFLGINILMTIIKYPQGRMYWSSIQGLRMDMIANNMPVNRFEEIKRFIHFVNNDEKEDPLTDRYWKVRPVANMLHQTFHDAVSPGEHQSVDEMLVPFKGRSLLKQYLKGKPKKWGFKIWVRASSGGYVHCFELYEGAKSITRSALGPVGDTVANLCHGIQGKYHKLFIDNLFTSIPLLDYLKAQDILVVGTVRLNRIPGVYGKLVSGKLLSRGSCSIATSNSNLTAVRWKDTKEVHLLSTYAGAEPEDEVQRWDRKEKKIITISRPFAISEYNRFMGGVDLMDRMIAHYPHGFKNKKWYLRLFFHFLNMSLVNAWLCYREKVEDIPLLKFKASVATTLIHIGTSENRKRGRPLAGQEPLMKKKRDPIMTAPRQLRYDGIGHYPKKVDAKQAPRCHDKICRSRTRYICNKCKEPVCPDCMDNFHTI